MTSPEEQIAAVLTAHQTYEWWPMTREFICTCETSIGRNYPDPAHREHVVAALVAALVAAGIGPTAEVLQRFRTAAELTVQDVRAQRGDHIAGLVEDSFAAHFARADR